jgi:hypothetical protein
MSGLIAGLRQQVDDLPKTLNGSVVRPHETRCLNYAAGAAAERAVTNPHIQQYTGRIQE